MTTRKALLLLALVCALLQGCADFRSPADPSGGAPDVLVATPSFSADIQPILTKRCSIGGCHSLGTGQADLVLVAPGAYDNLVDVSATQRPALRRIRPFRPDSSWLVMLIASDPGPRGPYSRMPLASLPLTDNQVGTIVNWVLQGAQRN